MADFFFRAVHGAEGPRHALMLARRMLPEFLQLLLCCVISSLFDYTPQMRRKIFWILFASLGLLADFTLSFAWAVIATIPILAVSWWVAYRSDWFSD